MGPIGLVEAVEGVIGFVGCHAAAGVAHGDFNPVIRRAGGDVYRAAVGRVFVGVIDEVDPRLMGQIGVGSRLRGA